MLPIYLEHTSQGMRVGGSKGILLYNWKQDRKVPVTSIWSRMGDNVGSMCHHAFPVLSVLSADWPHLRPATPQTNYKLREDRSATYCILSPMNCFISIYPYLLAWAKNRFLPLHCSLFPTLRGHPEETARWRLSPNILKPNGWEADLYSVFACVRGPKLRTSRQWHLELLVCSEAEAGKSMPPATTSAFLPVSWG